MEGNQRGSIFLAARFGALFALLIGAGACLCAVEAFQLEDAGWAPREESAKGRWGRVWECRVL